MPAYYYIGEKLDVDAAIKSAGITPLGYTIILPDKKVLLTTADKLSGAKIKKLSNKEANDLLYKLFGEFIG